MTETLDSYQAEQCSTIVNTLTRLGYAHLIVIEKVEAAAAERRSKVAEILTQGLDIGAVMAFRIPVTLEKHAEHGWVFVRQTKKRRGEMFHVSDYVR